MNFLKFVILELFSFWFFYYSKFCDFLKKFLIYDSRTILMFIMDIIKAIRPISNMEKRYTNFGHRGVKFEK